jgi:hypothetical protein
MAIESIGPRYVGNVVLAGSTARADRTLRDERPGGREGGTSGAIRVELSPEARRMGARRAIEAANAEAASSAGRLGVADSIAALPTPPSTLGRLRSA